MKTHDGIVEQLLFKLDISKEERMRGEIGKIVDLIGSLLSFCTDHLGFEGKRVFFAESVSWEVQVEIRGKSGSVSRTSFSCTCSVKADSSDPEPVYTHNLRQEIPLASKNVEAVRGALSVLVKGMLEMFPQLNTAIQNLLEEG